MERILPLNIHNTSHASPVRAHIDTQDKAKDGDKDRQV